MKKFSMNFKMIFGVILLVAAPLLVVGIFSVNKASDSLLESSKANAVQRASSLAMTINAVLKEEVNTARAIAEIPMILETVTGVNKNGQEAAINELKALDQYFVKLFKEIGDGYDMFFVADAKGNAVASSLADSFREKRINISDRDYFKTAQKGKINISDPVMSKSTGEAISVIAVPLKTPSGKFAGLLCTVFKMDKLTPVLAQAKTGKTGYAYMVDYSGTALSHPKKEIIFKVNISKLEGMEGIFKGIQSLKPGVEPYTFRGSDKIGGFASVMSTKWGVVFTQDAAEFMEGAYGIRNLILTVGILSLLITSVVVFFFSRTISKPIIRISDNLKNSADQVSGASRQISSTSQLLAEGTSEQAASIEETSSSLEEMSAMTKQNAENAGQADVLMKNTNDVVLRAAKSMKQLTGAMEDISKSSDETSKIIKTIDEIAFQTNLLALNAAVEAARAGEAGAGFAVVADEVRNLAMRAAEAAKTTSDLIEQSVNKIQDGSDMAVTTNDAFTEVSENSAKVGDLVGEIASVSQEQAQGIELINKAVAEMDRVVQQNAAGAEESASASEQLNGQAGQMTQYISDLVTLVDGESRPPRQDSHATKAAVHQPLVTHKQTVGKQKNQVAIGHCKEIRPNEIIDVNMDERGH